MKRWAINFNRAIREREQEIYITRETKFVKDER